MAAPRSIWNGAVAFGAVNVPVKLYGAIEDHSIRFKELHAKDGSEVGHKLVTSDGTEVDRDRIVKGYEVAPDEYVILTDEEIKAASQPARKAIELEDFVPGDQIDPVHYAKPYHCAPQDGAEAPYALLVRALEKSGRVGVGRFTLRQREQLVSVRPVDGVLRVQVMRFADELVDGESLDVPEPSKAPAKREVEMAATLVESLAGEFEPEKYEDTYRERVLELVRRKEKGEKIELPEREPAEESDDLMAALEASLKATSKGAKTKKKAKG
jgi:DNA end-binding protein Ku